MRQLDYGYAIPSGIPGGIFDLSPKTIVTRLLDADAEAGPGMGLVKGKKPGDTVADPSGTASADDFEGVFVNGSKQMENNRNGEVIAKSGDALGIMHKGKIWAIMADSATVNYGGKVALITAGDNIGKFTDADDAAETTKVSINAQFDGKADKEYGIAVIELK